jgi:diaminohydroxyphosphoribosylaminopyrimidine deaminase / 5-amino-6-(5-phosphoribosylamino)uracil reductase
MAAPDGSSRWITGSSARTRAHRRRAEVDAILVGAQTVLTDNPALTARDVDATRHPVRIVVDSSGRVPATAAMFTPDADVIVATTRRSSSEKRDEWAKAGAEVLVLEESENGVDLRALLKNLGSRDFLEVYCEGGGELATSLLAADLVDRMELNYGAVLLGRGGPEIGDLGVGGIASAPRWQPVEVESLDDGVIVVVERGEKA